VRRLPAAEAVHCCSRRCGRRKGCPPGVIRMSMNFDDGVLVEQEQ
jgi:hypothetical protein